eukprot:TRINITY_DN49411_c0_g1_i1.p1 TRINITY_DN49411_c0_g1~~TRINITY_DN49411_c0_g1_i1.p1  ORF type:complete len:358 (+),score=82.70 TRINITY_DN49411_c0_g1_i1:64-1137(+)
MVTVMKEATLSVSTQKGVGRYRIENFGLLHRKKGEPVSSGPIIRVADADWEILVYPAGSEQSKDGWVRVSVRCSGRSTEVRARYSIACINAAGEVVHSLGEEAVFARGDGWGFNDFIRHDKLTDNVVIFEACVTVIGAENIRVQDKSVDPRVSQQDLVADFKQLWESGESSDVTLEVAGESLHVHSLLLSARSPVFSTMLKSQMTEASTRVIRIEDFEAETMRYLCEFLYTGSISVGQPWENSEAASALVQAASKYQISSLVRWCSLKIAEKMVVETAADWLVLACQLGTEADVIKKKCLLVFSQNLADIQSTEGWQRLMANGRVLAELAPVMFQAACPRAAVEQQPRKKKPRVAMA